MSRAGGRTSPGGGALLTCEPRGADAAVPVNSVQAGSVDARVTGAVIKIDFTVDACKGNSGEKPRDVTAETLTVSAGDARCHAWSVPGPRQGLTAAFSARSSGPWRRVVSSERLGRRPGPPPACFALAWAPLLPKRGGGVRGAGSAGT